MDTFIRKQYELAKEIYAKHYINTDEVLKRLSNIKISMHCWPDDDIQGFLIKIKS